MADLCQDQGKKITTPLFSKYRGVVLKVQYLNEKATKNKTAHVHLLWDQNELIDEKNWVQKIS